MFNNVLEIPRKTLVFEALQEKYLLCVERLQLLLFHLFQEYFHSRVFEEGMMTKEEIVEAVSVPDGVSVNVVVAIPFLDVNPIAGSE